MQTDLFDLIGWQSNLIAELAKLHEGTIPVDIQESCEKIQRELWKLRRGDPWALVPVVKEVE